MKSLKSINRFKSVIQTINNIIKAHVGEIKVETKEGEGTEFIIQLPVWWSPTQMRSIESYYNNGFQSVDKTTQMIENRRFGTYISKDWKIAYSMANTYHQIYLQTVFAVKYRKAVIDKEWKGNLFGVIGNLINETKCNTIIVNGVEDHVH